VTSASCCTTLFDVDLGVRELRLHERTLPMPNDVAPRTTDLHFLTIVEAARPIERPQLSPVALTRSFLDRIAAIDPQVNAYLLVTAEQALDQARIAEAAIMAGNYRGPMHGIPFGLKDIYCTAGIQTTNHSRTRRLYSGLRRHHRRKAASGRCDPARQACHA
jgi:Amidase